MVQYAIYVRLNTVKKKTGAWRQFIDLNILSIMALLTLFIVVVNTQWRSVSVGRPGRTLILPPPSPPLKKEKKLTSS